MFSSGSSTLNAVTVAANSAGSLSGNGGGLAVAAGVTIIKNTLIAGNTSSAAASAPDCSGSLQSAGYNLLQNNSGCVLTGISTGNLLGLDPKLGSLVNNGGLTPTHAIALDSPALEAGTCTTSTGTSLTEDQRGILARRVTPAISAPSKFENPLQSGPVYSVTSIIDVTSSTCTFSNCSLRDAINAANTRPNGTSLDEIHFNFPGSGTQVIYLQTNLPAITDPLVIDGFTQPGASSNTLPTGSNAVRLVTLDGSQLDACTAGLTISGSGSTIKGLNIQNFSCDGIGIGGSGNQALENAIFDNSGAGVHVNSGSANTISSSSIHDNLSGGILLEPNTNNNQAVSDPSVATTRFADAIPSTDVGGEFTALPNTSYKVEIFQNPTCSNAQGANFMSSSLVSTDATGTGTFLVNVKPSFTQGSGVTITFTGEDGSTSSFSGCTAVGLLNNSWLAALPLSLTPAGGQSSANAFGKIYQPGQSQWFKFPISPDGDLLVTVSGIPGGVITLHRDLLKTYKQLETPGEAGALAANDLPGGYLPGGYLPGGYLPGGYLPGGYLPGGYLPGGYLPGGYLPGGYFPGGYLPGGYLPGGYLPGGYLPGGYLPVDYLPGGYLPGGYLPELYSGSIRRSLLAVSNTNEPEQTIERNTWDLSEDMYIQVSGPASLSGSFNLQVTYQSGVCENVPSLPDISPALPVIAGVQPQSGSSETLILWDSARMLASDPSQDVEALRTKLADFAARPDILGQVIDLSAQVNGAPVYPRVAQANQIADANTACVTAKNTAASEIKNIVEVYREANSIGAGATTLKYILLVGTDNEIPFFRYPDQAGLASEADYIPPVKDGSASEASLRQSQVLGQDEYGAQYQASRSGYSVPVPQLAVSRLVRTVEQISGMLDAYIAVNGVISPDSALVTGYDFVADAADKVQSELTLGLNPLDCANQAGGCKTVDTLIQPQENGLVGAWSAVDLRQKLLPASNNASDLIFFAGHFSAGSVLAADYTSSILSSELFGSPVDFTNSLVFALGCHSGYSIPGPDALAFSPTPDWAEAFAEQAATYIAATGYAYGDTELTEYGEKLYLILVQKLRTGTGPISIGQALVDSKRDYLAGRVNLEGIDDKTLLETTLYGLPMLKVDLPGERIIKTQPQTITTAAQAQSGPGASLGLLIGQPLQGGAQNLVVLNPSLTQHQVSLTNVTDQTPVVATYFSGADGGTTARPAEPIFPLERYNVKVDGLILRGIGFRGGTYTDLLDVTPLTSAATTENSRGHPGFFSDFYYPIQNWAANYYDSIEGSADWLVITPAQYRSNNLSSSTGTLRTYQEMDFRLYYLDQNWTSSANAQLKAAAISAAPDIRDINASPIANGLHFQVEVLADPTAGVQEAWVTFTSSQGAWYRSWQSLDLQQNLTNPMLWEGDLVLPSGISPADLHYIVQAANGAGSVSLVDPNLPNASGVPDIQPDLRPTHIVLNPTDAVGEYNQSGLVTMTLLDSTNNQPIQERTVVFAVENSSGQIVLVQPAITNYEGKATLGALPVPVGTYFLAVYYGSTVGLNGEVVDLTYDTYLGSSASGTITIQNVLPIAQDDSYTLNEDVPLNVAAPGILENDSDLEGSSLTALLVSSPVYGMLTLNPDGSFSYIPNQDFNGLDSFSYIANDGSQDSAETVVSLAIAPVQDTPVAFPDSSSTPEDTPIVFDVLVNDHDADGDILTVTSVGIPSHGSSSTDGTLVTYTPGPGYSGTDSFEYTITDGYQSATGTVNVTISSVNFSPICTNAAPDTGIWIWPPNKEFVPIHIIGITDPDGDPLVITITSIYQDEPLKGNTPTGTGLGTDTAIVLSDRDGNGNGRVYHIYFSVSDGMGGTCQGKVRVGVFDNQGGGGLDPIDGGSLYDSTLSTASASLPQPYALALVFSGPLATAVAIRRNRDAA